MIMLQAGTVYGASGATGISGASGVGATGISGASGVGATGVQGASGPSYFDRTGTVLSPHTVGDSLDMGTGSITAGEGQFTQIVDTITYLANIAGAEYCAYFSEGFNNVEICDGPYALRMDGELYSSGSASFAGQWGATGAFPLILGSDGNTVGKMKLWSGAGNNYCTTIAANSQTANANYNLPVASANGLLRNTKGSTGATGVWNWDSTLSGTKVYYVSDSGATGALMNRKLTFTNGLLTAET